MSLINQMLRDLEQRQSVATATQPGVSGVAGPSVGTRGKQTPWGRLLVLVVIGAALIAAALWWAEQPVTQTEIKVPDLQPQPVAVSPTPVAVTPSEAEAIEKMTLANVEQPTKSSETTIPPMGAKPEASVVETKPAAILGVKTTPTVVTSKRPVSPAEQARLAQKTAQEALQSGRVEQAISHLQHALTLQPTWVEPRTQLAGIYAELQQTKQAQMLLQQGLLLNPSSEPWAMHLAQLQMQNQKPELAIETLRSARTAGAMDVNLDLLLAALYQRMAQMRDAAELYQDVLVRDAQNEKAWLGLAIVLQTMGQPRDALAAFREADRIGGHVSEVQQYIRQRMAELSGQG